MTAVVVVVNKSDNNNDDEMSEMVTLTLSPIIMPFCTSINREDPDQQAPMS